MISFMEWGAFFITALGLWKFYGKPQDILEKAHKLYKKLEGILVGAPTPKNIQHPEDSFQKNDLLRSPVTRIEFKPRNYTELNAYRPRRVFEETRFCTSFGNQSPHNLKPGGGFKCPVCTNPERNSRVPSSDEKGFTNCLYPDTNGPENPWYIRKFAFVVHFARKWYLGYQHHYLSLKQVMECKNLNAAIREQAKGDFEERRKKPGFNPTLTLEALTKQHWNQTEKIVKNMRAKMPKPEYFSVYARFAPWIIGKTLGKIYPKILVKDSQMDELKKVRETGIPLLYLPLHRSHVDYVLVSWSLIGNDIRSPVVAAGDNLNNIPAFSLMMKSVGGFFIKRRLDKIEGKKDHVYRTILHTYMTQSLLEDNDMEFFVEGGRTRTGKPCLPKGGLLSIIVDAFLTQKIEDIYIVPVNFSYDRLLEGSFARELLGQPKVNESFASAFLGLWNSLQAKFGNARVDIGHPFSMKEFIQAFQAAKAHVPAPISRSSSTDSDDSGVDNNNVEVPVRKTLESRTSISSIYGTDVVIEDQRDLINNIGKHALFDGIKCFSLMSTHAIGFLLLSKYRAGVSLKKLEEEVIALGQEFLGRGHDIGFSGDISQIIDHGLTVLGPGLVRREIRRRGPDHHDLETFIIPATTLPNVIELNYYATCVTPVYALESAIATSLISLMEGVMEGKVGETPQMRLISKSDLMDTIVELCQFLHHEFIFHPPCQTVQEAVALKLKDFVAQGILLQNNNDNDTCILVNTTEKGMDRLEFLKNLLRPLLDTYAVSVRVLPKLIGCEATEKQLQMEMLAEIKVALQQKRISYAECAILDPIKNAIKLLHSWDVLESVPKGRDTIYFLRDPFDDLKLVSKVIQRFQKFQT